MMVGSTWKANTKPNASARARSPNTKAAPSMAKLMILTNNPLIRLKNARPPGTSMTMMAKVSCRPMPAPTSFQSTDERCMETDQAMQMSTASPKTPNRILPIMRLS